MQNIKTTQTEQTLPHTQTTVDKVRAPVVPTPHYTSEELAALCVARHAQHC